MQENTQDPPPDPVVPPGEARRLRYRILTLLWGFPSLGAAWILWRSTPPAAGGDPIWTRLQGLPIEGWISLVVIGLHVFWWAAWRRAECHLRAQ